MSGGETRCICYTLDGQAAPADESDASDASDPSDESDASDAADPSDEADASDPTDINVWAPLQPAAAVLTKGSHQSTVLQRAIQMQTA